MLAKFVAFDHWNTEPLKSKLHVKCIFKSALGHWDSKIHIFDENHILYLTVWTLCITVGSSICQIGIYFGNHKLRTRFNQNVEVAQYNVYFRNTQMSKPWWSIKNPQTEHTVSTASCSRKWESIFVRQNPWLGFGSGMISLAF